MAYNTVHCLQLQMMQNGVTLKTKLTKKTVKKKSNDMLIIKPSQFLPNKLFRINNKKNVVRQLNEYTIIANLSHPRIQHTYDYVRFFMPTSGWR